MEQLKHGEILLPVNCRLMINSACVAPHFLTVNGVVTGEKKVRNPLILGHSQPPMARRAILSGPPELGQLWQRSLS